MIKNIGWTLGNDCPCKCKHCYSNSAYLYFLSFYDKIYKSKNKTQIQEMFMKKVKEKHRKLQEMSMN